MYIEVFIHSAFIFILQNLKVSHLCRNYYCCIIHVEISAGFHTGCVFFVGVCLVPFNYYFFPLYTHFNNMQSFVQDIYRGDVGGGK